LIPIKSHKVRGYLESHRKLLELYRGNTLSAERAATIELILDYSYDLGECCPEIDALIRKTDEDLEELFEAYREKHRAWEKGIRPVRW